MLGLLGCISPNQFERLRHSVVNHAGRDSGALQCRPQYPKIGLAMVGEPVNRGPDSVDVEHGTIERIPMSPILRKQERSVNVEQVSVRVPPAEAIWLLDIQCVHPMSGVPRPYS